jgi:hypothetical protein
MSKIQWFVVLGLAWIVISSCEARSQTRPYIGYVYPAGGQQGATFQIRLGGQGMDDVNTVLVTGTGVTARIVEYYWRQSNQEQSLINEQLQILKKTNAPATPTAAKKTAEPAAPAPAKEKIPEESAKAAPKAAAPEAAAPGPATLIAKIERRIGEYVSTPACASIAGLLFVEITIAPDAPPGEREIRVVTLRGVSNPLVFHIGQLPEYSRKPMRTATLQVLGKEAQSLRKRPPGEVEDRVTIPSTLNGQIASGEMNRYRFPARKGQRLLITTQGRQLIPYIADAVPGWFQPVLVLYDVAGKELAYNDDYRFKPDPTLFYEVPQDGDYIVAIYDSLYRGREDFVYRITIGELPYVTGIFPLGGYVGKPVAIKMNGWNLKNAVPAPPAGDAGPGVYKITAHGKGFISNRVPFALDTLPESFEKERNNDAAHAQKIYFPIIINGRIDRPGDWDVFKFAGMANDTIVAEVYARRLDSPLDSLLKLTDEKGNLLAFNDDREDLESGLNTHHADSYLMFKLPADGNYCIHVGDTAHNGGEEYAYRLRISAPQPDFALRAVASSTSLRSKSSATLSVYAIRKDGFNGAIKLSLKDPPSGVSSSPATLTATQAMTQLTVKTSLAATQEPINLVIEGIAKIGDKEIAHTAVPAEDRMQAFLWRHLVPAQELKALVFDPSYVPPPKRVPAARPAAAEEAKPAVDAGAPATAPPAVATAPPAVATAPPAVATKPKFTKQQVASRLRELKRLYEEGYLMDDFYWEKVAECETAQ